jgi:hypothetical protein
MLGDEIIQLIELKQEGAYWDFKREWYSPDKNSDLLHDIICMANNLANRNAYIIIGIDENQDYCVRDVRNDSNRRDTQKIIDFLKDKDFAGDARPIVYVETVLVFSQQVDVIVIPNRMDTPYFLTKGYKNVMQNNIYTRIMDTNTPKNNSADVQYIEYLWKKRFGLLSPPLERIQYYLKQKDAWISSPTDCETSKRYYKYAPEFIIEHTLEDKGDAYQYYLLNQTDSIPHWREIRLYYQQTLLRTFEGVSLDGGRYFTPTPITDGISLNQRHNWDVTFKYFVVGTLEYLIHDFYYNPDGDEETHSHDRFLECIIVFSTEQEKGEFKNFVLDNWDDRNKYSYDIHIPEFEERNGDNIEKQKKQYLNVQILKRMYDKFKEKGICNLTRGDL